MAEAIYLLSAFTSLLAAGLLLRYYLSRRSALLLWSCIGFFGLAINSVMVYVDLVLFSEVDLSLPRTLAGTIGMVVMLYGFIWEAKR
jgi:hypothetical protein